MTENQKNGHDNQARNSNSDADKKENTDKNSDIIELSDIAIGITPEDDAIVELTEEIIDEAFVGFTGATSELVEEGERVLDLSSGAESESENPVSGFDPASGPDVSDSEEIAGPIDHDDDNLEEDISRELDDYFGTEEDVTFYDEAMPAEETVPIEETQIKDTTEEKPKASQMHPADAVDISPARLDDAIERVIRKMFAEKINRILDEVIERTVTEEIDQLKDYLIGITGKKE